MSIDETVQATHDRLVGEQLLTVKDLMKRWQVSRSSVENAGLPRTRIAGLPGAVRYHPLDVVLHEQRNGIGGAVTAEHVKALADLIDGQEDVDPKVLQLCWVLRELVLREAAE